MSRKIAKSVKDCVGNTEIVEVAKPAGEATGSVPIAVSPEPGLEDIDPLEADLLAIEMAKSYRGFVEYYRKMYKVDGVEAIAKTDEILAPGNEEYEDRIRHGPPNEASWFQLEHLLKNDPPAFNRRWGDIKKTALNELESGWRAARGVEGHHNDPWDRAQFMALRHSLMEEWKPANGIEQALIDTMAQAQTLYLHWMKIMAEWMSIELQDQKSNYERDGRWYPPRVSSHQALEEAAAMADRFNRLFLRTLRQLRDLRRYTPEVTIQSAGQVNIGGQQINVAGGSSTG